ncbi:MAG: DNA internalization-related competence protein ComEC/Rec2 [Coriobacteriia bacterium]|nr:DNA internalization-related competence protein ComEC/Rec2 [Coriobacteriia bacterium]
MIVILTLMAFLLGFSSGAQFYGDIAGQIKGGSDLQGQLDLLVIDDTRMHLRSFSSVALVQSSAGAHERVRVFWNDANQVVPKGSVLQTRASFTPLREDQRYLYHRGIVGTLSLSVIENIGFSSGFLGAIDQFRHDNVQNITSIEGEGAALLLGILLGYREKLHGSVVEQDFFTCGLSHLIAVSGTHLAVIAALFGWFLRRLPLNRPLEVAILLTALLLYVILTGLQPSAIRSSIMAGVAACSIFVGRRGHSPSALVAAALVMLLVYPANAYSLGFWLSVFAVMGITLFTNLVAHWIKNAAPLQNNKDPGALSQALALTITAMAATMPLSIPVFAALPLIGPLANLLGTPLICLSLMLGMTALVITPFAQAAGSFLLELAAFISEACAQLAALMVRIPGASTPLDISLAGAVCLGIGLSALLYYTWPVPHAKALRRAAALLCATALALFVLSPLFVNPRLVVMDVGQGDALLVQDRASAILIDTGSSDTALTHALARNKIRNLQAVIITHLDDDHAGALRRLRGLVSVDKVYFAYGLLEHCPDNVFIAEAQALVGEANVGELKSGDELKVSNALTLQVLWPTRIAYEGSNAESICLLLQYDANEDGIPEHQALLTGDCEQEELALLLKEYPNLEVALLKVGHHGSRKALTSEQVQALGCKVALISVGANNTYGHPTKSVLDALSAHGVITLRTDEHRDITCVLSGDTIKLKYTDRADVHY